MSFMYKIINFIIILLFIAHIAAIEWISKSSHPALFHVGLVVLMVVLLLINIRFFKRP